MNKIKMNNKGYSLLEVMIVVSIIALLTGISFMSFRVLNTRQVDECVKKLKMGLESNRITTMGKLSANVSVYVDSDGCLVLEEEIDGNSKKKKIGDENLRYQYEYDSKIDPIPGEANKITLSFDRNSGSLKPQVSDKYIIRFIISLDTTQVSVKIDKLTGRVSVE